MQLRNSIVIVGATLAIVVPSAGAAVAPDPIGDGPGTATVVKHYTGVIKKVAHTTKAASRATGPLTENSNGASRPQTRPVTASTTKKAAPIKKVASKPATRIVVPRMIVAPPGPLLSSGNDGSDDCTTFMVNCTDEQYCDLWGFNCPVPGNGDQPVDSAPADGASN